MQFEINYLAVVVSTVAAMVLGFLWYGPLFGKAWMKSHGWDPNNQQQMEKMKQGATKGYVVMLIGAFITAYVLTHVLQAFETDSVWMALQGAFWVWLGFIAPVKIGDQLWAGKSMSVFYIEALYYLVNLGVMSIILYSWK